MGLNLETVPLRQSYSGYLLGRNGKTLLELVHDIANGRTPTKAMEDGSLVDQLLYGGGNYQELGTCTKRSGPDKGQTFEPEDYATKDAQEQRDAIRAEGRIPVLKSEVSRALEQAASIRDALMRHGIDLYSSGGHTRCLGEEPLSGLVPGIYTQPLVTGDIDGIHCRGTFDLIEVAQDLTWRIIDTKLSERADQEWAEKQAANMGWDCQSGAYIEAAALGLGLDPELFRGYGLAICEKRSKLNMSAVHWLSPMFLKCGKEQWERCKAAWLKALELAHWPGVEDSTIEPPGYYVSRIFDERDDSGADDLSSIGLDTSGLEVE